PMNKLMGVLSHPHLFMSRPTFLALFGAALLWAPTPQAAEVEQTAEKTTAAIGLLRQVNDGFVAVFEKVAPAVVVIEATKRMSDEEEREFKGFDFFLNE